MKRMVFTNKEINNIKDLYQKGLSCESIGEYYGVSKTPIMRILKNCKKLNKGKSDGKKIVLSEKQKEIIKDLYLLKNKNCEEIGKELKLTPSFINKYLGTVSYRRTKGIANSVRRQGKKLPKKVKENMKIAQQKLSQSGKRKQTGGICKTFMINGLRCQGTYEKFYIEKLINEKITCPKNCESIITPFGVYYPDFLYEDRLIEIKSDYTFNILIGEKKSRFTKQYETKQLLKLKWVNENIKPVEILVVDKRNNEIIKKNIL
jgi:transposase